MVFPDFPSRAGARRGGVQARASSQQGSRCRLCWGESVSRNLRDAPFELMRAGAGLKCLKLQCLGPTYQLLGRLTSMISATRSQQI